MKENPWQVLPGDDLAGLAADEWYGLAMGFRLGRKILEK
jgi:hypothetical protein